MNESPNNTGLTELPPVAQPDVWYTYTLSAEFPELETGGIGPMAGPAYQFDAKATKGKNPTAWPEYYDGVPLFYEWTRDYIKAFFTEGGDLTRIEDVLASFDLQNPIDMEFGPNGSLYVLNYGNGFFGSNQPGAELVRIDYLGPSGDYTPTVNVTASQVEGAPPLTVSSRAQWPIRRVAASSTRGTSTVTATSTRASRTPRSRTRRRACTAPRSR